MEIQNKREVTRYYFSRIPNVSKFKIKNENSKNVECKATKPSINRKKFLACGVKNSETCVIHTLKIFHILQLHRK